MGTHGKHGLKAHCSAKHKIRKNSISGMPRDFFLNKQITPTINSTRNNYIKDVKQTKLKE